MVRPAPALLTVRCQVTEAMENVAGRRRADGMRGEKAPYFRQNRTLYATIGVFGKFGAQ